jgi:hypothetical protein
MEARRSIHEWGAVLLLALGGLLFGVGWIGGIVLLWTSEAWSTRDKWVGTAVVAGWSLLAPFGLVVWAWYSDREPLELAILMALVALAVPILGAVYLAARADLRRPG